MDHLEKPPPHKRLLPGSYRFSILKVRGMKFNKNETNKQEIWNTYAKIIQVRNPFERLVSAYTDKLIPDSEGFSTIYIDISKNICKNFKAFRQNVIDRTANDTTASFEDFVNFLLVTTNREEHWNHYYKLCAPCMIDYDYIVKFETLSDDIDHLKVKLNISAEHSKNFFPKKSSQIYSNKTKEYFKMISKEKAKALYELYKHDFELFGYDRPSWLS